MTAARDALAAALPTDWEDNTVVVGFEDERGFNIPQWGPPEVAASAILAALVADGWNLAKVGTDDMDRVAAKLRRRFPALWTDDGPEPYAVAVAVLAEVGFTRVSGSEAHREVTLGPDRAVCAADGLPWPCREAP